MTELNLHPKILAIKQAVDAIKFGRASVWERSAKDTLKAAYQDASDNMVDDDAPWCEDCGKPERWGFRLSSVRHVGRRYAQSTPTNARTVSARCAAIASALSSMKGNRKRSTTRKKLGLSET